MKRILIGIFAGCALALFFHFVMRPTSFSPPPERQRSVVAEKPAAEPEISSVSEAEYLNPENLKAYEEYVAEPGEAKLSYKAWLQFKKEHGVIPSGLASEKPPDGFSADINIKSQDALPTVVYLNQKEKLPSVVEVEKDFLPYADQKN